MAAGVGEAAGGGAEDAGEREEAGERVRRERGGRVNLAVEEEALDRVREEPAHVVEEGDGSSAHSVPGAGAMWVRSVHLCFRHGSLALLAWVGRSDLRSAHLTLSQYHYAFLAHVPTDKRGRFGTNLLE